jgi:hypothetical protein
VKVKMKVYMSGTRDGEAWPLPGGEVELSDAEGAKLCANGLATPVRSDEDDVEKRGGDKPAAEKPSAKPKAKAK